MAVEVTVDLYRCARCGLQWVSDGHPTQCPKCLRRHPFPPKIIVAGRNVRVQVVREYGLEAGIMNSDVRKGLENFPMCCPHGFLTFAICPDCPS